MSTPSDQPLPSAPKSPLSGAAVPPAPAPAPAAAAPAPSSLPQSAYKVTRSPFSPRIAGATTGQGGPMSLGSGASFDTAPGGGATTQRKTVSATGKIVAEESSALVVLDLLAAGVAVAVAVMMALSYFKK